MKLRSLFVNTALAALLPFLSGCSSVNPHYDPKKPHHRPEGFQNRYRALDKSEGFWKWQSERWVHPPPKTQAGLITGVKPDVAFLATNRSAPTLTWIGHATLLLQLDGLNILTDPIFSDRASPVSFLGPKRHQRPGLLLSELPHIDLVLVSHNHYDHLDLESIRALQGQAGGPPRFYVPLGVEAWFEKNIPGAKLEGSERNVFWLDWDESRAVQGKTGPLQLHFLAVQHWSARTPWDRNRTLWGSWALLHPQLRFWFGGDLGYSRDTVDIGRKMGGFDLAAIPIGGYKPRWFMSPFHINPEEAVQVMKDVGADQAVGIHWGTFEKLTDEPLDQPPKDLQAALQRRGLPANRFITLLHGSTLRLKTGKASATVKEGGFRGT